MKHDQNVLRANILEYYNALDRNIAIASCHITVYWFSKADIKAACLVPKALTT